MPGGDHRAGPGRQDDQRAHDGQGEDHGQQRGEQQQRGVGGDGAGLAGQQRDRPADPPGQSGDQHAVEQHEGGEGNHRDPARAHQVEVRVALTQGFEPRPGQDEQQGAVGQPSGPAGGQPAPHQQVAAARGRPEEQRREDDEADRAPGGDLPDDLAGLGDPPLGVVAGRHRQQPHHQPPPGPRGHHPSRDPRRHRQVHVPQVPPHHQPHRRRLARRSRRFRRRRMRRLDHEAAPPNHRDQPGQHDQDADNDHRHPCSMAPRLAQLARSGCAQPGRRPCA